MDVNEDFVLFDVWEFNEWVVFNIGGEFILLGSLMGCMGELEQYKEDEVIVYCCFGNCFGFVKEFMEWVGFKNVCNLFGGMMSWVENYGIGKQQA